MRKEEKELKAEIEKHIQHFQQDDFLTNAENLLTTLGYKSQRQAKIDKEFLCQKGLNQDKTFFADWLNAGLLFQVTGEDLSAQGSILQSQFEAERIKSYLFYAVELKGSEYSRGALAQITRYVNKLFPMPVFILFKSGEYLTLAIIDRRENLKDVSKDVLEKVTLIRNIAIAKPHRAHIEILFDLSYPELQTKYCFSNFDGLHQAWQKTLDTKELNKKFYRELSAWYFYAKSQVLFPDDVEKDADKRNSINLIRLITRLIFVWFIKEKGLVPEELFDENFIKDILNYSDITGSTYYKAILQNLFFATLNLEMNKDKPGSRVFFTREDGYHSQQHLMPAYRYARFFKEPEKALKLFENIPFLNGGLFENLDTETEENGKRTIKRIDCFSDHPDNETRLKVPDDLFFSDLKKVDLSAVYEDRKHKSEEFRGIINIFKRYKFTIEENTPIEEEIALDPELLGKVFENLLASYNPETHTTARKATGSFYTPREIVDYMVDESLVAYLETQLKNQVPEFKDMNDLGGLIRDTLSYTEKAHPFTKDHEVEALINAIDNCKILDPACGSGAFPMGILHKLVYLLHKLDPLNARWMNRQIGRVNNAIREVEQNEDVQIRENLIHDLEKNIASIEDAFLNNELDYGRKLYLIENCIYGVDIQPIAIQIAKLRFFISLVIDQKIDPNKPNLNIRALPNLETKFVAANTLIGLKKPAQGSLGDDRIRDLEKQLIQIRQKHFSAKNRKEKKDLREKDEILRHQLSTELQKGGWPKTDSDLIANWNPYNQNTSSQYFDPEWMFGIEDGFDIVIGNPPYGFRSVLSSNEKQFFRKMLKIDFPSGDIAELFIDISLSKFVIENGVLTFIIPKKSLYGESWSNVRQIWIANDIRFLMDASQAFENVLLEQNAFSIQKRKHNKGKIAVGKLDQESNMVKVFGEFPLAEIFTNDLRNAQIYSGLYPSALLKKILKNAMPNTSSLIKSEIGISNITPHLTFESEGNYPCIKGIDIVRYGLKPDVRYIKGKIARKYIGLYNDEKIIGQEIIAHIQNPYPHILITLFFDDKRRLFNDTCVEIKALDMRLQKKFLLGYLQSEFCNWYAYNFVYNRAIRTMHFINYYVTQIPIPKCVVDDLEQQSPIIKLVDRILAAKRENPQADTSVLEREIDRLVYELYGLTEEEIKVVESV